MSALSEFKKSKENISPIRKLWNLISVASGVIGMSSISSNIIDWKSFMLDIVSFYDITIRHGLLMIFHLFNISVPIFIADYIFFGILIMVSHYKSLSDADVAGGFGRYVIPLELSNENVFYYLKYIVYTVFLWPVFVGKHLSVCVGGFSESKSKNRWEGFYHNLDMKQKIKIVDIMIRNDFSKYYESVRLFHWIFSVIIVFVILVIIDKVIMH